MNAQRQQKHMRNEQLQQEEHSQQQQLQQDKHSLVSTVDDFSTLYQLPPAVQERFHLFTSTIAAAASSKRYERDTVTKLNKLALQMKALTNSALHSLTAASAGHTSQLLKEWELRVNVLASEQQCQAVSLQEITRRTTAVTNSTAKSVNHLKEDLGRLEKETRESTSKLEQAIGVCQDQLAKAATVTSEKLTELEDRMEISVQEEIIAVQAYCEDLIHKFIKTTAAAPVDSPAVIPLAVPVVSDTDPERRCWNMTGIEPDPTPESRASNNPTWIRCKECRIPPVLIDPLGTYRLTLDVTSRQPPVTVPAPTIASAAPFVPSATPTDILTRILAAKTTNSTPTPPPLLSMKRRADEDNDDDDSNSSLNSNTTTTSSIRRSAYSVESNTHATAAMTSGAGGGLFYDGSVSSTRIEVLIEAGEVRILESQQGQVGGKSSSSSSSSRGKKGSSNTSANFNRLIWDAAGYSLQVSVGEDGRLVREVGDSRPRLLVRVQNHHPFVSEATRKWLISCSLQQF